MLAVLALVVLVIIWDWNWFRGLAESYASRKAGREVSIGHLDVDVFWPPTLELDQVRLADAEWAGEEPMGQAEQLAFSVRPLSLFGLDPQIPTLVVRNARLELVRNQEGEPNWPQRSEEELESEIQAHFGHIAIHDSSIRYVDPRDDTDFGLAVDTDEAEGFLVLDGSGDWSGESASLEARLGQAAALVAGRGFPISGRLDIGDSWLEIDGAAVDGTGFRQLSFATDIGGPDPAFWGEITDWPIPSLPPYELSAQLERDGDTWRVRELSGDVGDSTLAGSATVDAAAEPTYVQASLRSSHLDFDDLAGLAGGPPGTESGETASAAQREQARQMEADDRLLPDRRLRFDRFDRVNADIEYDAESVTSTVPISRFSLDVHLEDAVMDVESFNIGLAGGALHGAAKLDSTTELPSVRIDFTAENLDFRQLTTTQGERLDQAVGRLHGKGYIQGSGHTTAEVFAVADGAVTAAAGGGRIDAMIVEMAGLDLGEMLVTKLHPGDETVTVQCALAHAALEAGVAELDGAISTDDTQFLATGTIDLESEQMDLVVNGEARDFSLFSFNAPLRIEGPLTEPSVRPDRGAIFRGVMAAILGAVTPPAAVLALIEDGDATKAGCQTLVENLQAGQSVDEAAEG